MAVFKDPQAIGKITTAEQSFTIQRGDQTLTLNEGDFIYLDDVISAGGTAVGIAFADETTMSVDPNSTMVIDDFVYDPENPTVGSMNANVLEGNFSFVSGQIAKVGNDAMKVTTPVLTIGVRGTQVAGKANTDGEENEIVLLPNEDGSVGQVMIKNESGEVLLTEAYQATVITDPYTVPTVPVILPKEVVLKKFATTIATTKKTEAKAEVERETEEAAKEKAEAEKEAEELEEEKEELEEEKEQLEEEAEELEEKSEELEEEAEELEEEAEELEEAEEQVLEEKEQAEEKKEEVAEEIEELEEQLDDAPVEEREKIEQELQQLEEEFEEIEEEVQQIEKEIEVVAEKKADVEKKVQEIEKEFAEVQEDFAEIEAKVEIVEKEVQQVIEQELIVEQKVLAVEERFEAIVQNFEKFQEEFVQEFENFIPEEELQQFIEEAPIEFIEEFKENVMEEIKEEIDKPQEIIEEEPEDIFAEENVKEQMQELENNEEFQELEEMIEEDNVMINLDNGEIVNPEDGPGFNEDNDVFDVDEENQVDDQVVEQLLQEEKEKVLAEEPIAQEMEDFFKEMDPENEVVDQQVQDMVVVNAGNIDEYFDGAGDGIMNADDYYALEAEQDDLFEVVDANENAYYNAIEADDIMDQFIYELAQEQDVNVAPWLDMPNDVSVNENLAVGSTLGNVYGSDANGDQLTYSIFADPSGKLRISGNRIYLDSAFSVTEDTTYSILLKVQDPYGAADIDEWQITVENNHSPVISNTSAVSLAEDVSTGTSVSTISASDAESETITYSITAGNTGNAFTINSSTGAITTAAALDYETTTSYNLTITATDAFGNTSTTNQVVNVTDVNEVISATHTQSISNTSLDAWGARYSQDMVLNNAWAEGKILALHGDRSISGNNQAGGQLDDLFSVTYDTDASGNWASNTLKYASQFSQIWDFNWNTRINTNTSLTDAWKAYLMSGGSLVSITEHSYWDDKRNQDQEDFINIIDTTSSTNTGMISGVGNGSQNIAAEYRAWSDTNSVLSATVGGSTSVYHKEYMGRGDLVSSNGDGNEGAIAEWSREDTEAEYTGTFLAWGDIDGHSSSGYIGSTNHHKEIATWLQEQNEDAMTESDGAGIVVDSEFIPVFRDTVGSGTHTAENDITAVEAIHLGNNVYIGGGMDHIDLVWDDSADSVYWAFNADLDNGATPTQADDHYGVIGYDRDGDGDLWETTDTFNLDKIKILDDSEDYLTQDSDATGDYSFKVTPVTYSGGSWSVEIGNTVTVANTTGYNAYLDLSNFSQFDDINYALIETESALISEVVVSG